MKKRIVMHFPNKLIGKAIVYHLVKDYDLVFNILQARITPNEKGLIVMELSGDDNNFAEGLRFLKKQGIEVETLSKDIRKNDERCTHCGACIAVCPTGALCVDRDTMEVNFDIDKCIGCELCVSACPVKAMEVKID